MYKLNKAPIFFLGHPYIESTAVLSDTARQHLKNSGTDLSPPQFWLSWIIATISSSTLMPVTLVLEQFSLKSNRMDLSVIAYASRTLSKPERHYCVTRWELLAVVTFIHHFRQYQVLLGIRFSVRTDDAAGVCSITAKDQ